MAWEKLLGILQMKIHTLMELDQQVEEYQRIIAIHMMGKLNLEYKNKKRKQKQIKGGNER